MDPRSVPKRLQRIEDEEGKAAADPLSALEEFRM